MHNKHVFFYLFQVIGQGRLPELRDEQDLPFVKAVLHETHRMASVVYLGVSRFTTDNITLDSGDVIPEGSTILPNLYAIMRDGRFFENPDMFSPERFITANGSFAPDKHVIPFGSGKRLCLGQSLAEKEYFLFFTGLLQLFNVRPADGTKEMPGYGAIDTSGEGMIRYPPDQALRLDPR